MDSRNTTYVIYGTEVIKVRYTSVIENDAVDLTAYIWDENEHEYQELETSAFYSAMSESEAANIYELINHKISESIGLLEDEI